MHVFSLSSSAPTKTQQQTQACSSRYPPGLRKLQQSRARPESIRRLILTNGSSPGRQQAMHVQSIIPCQRPGALKANKLQAQPASATVSQTIKQDVICRDMDKKPTYTGVGIEQTAQRSANYAESAHLPCNLSPRSTSDG